MNVDVAERPQRLAERSAALPAGDDAATGPSRLPLLDAIRLIAAAGIVWLHAAVSPTGLLFMPLGTFGVPFYVIVAVLFTTREMTRPQSRPLGEYLLSRIRRLYVPFLFWSALYLTIANAMAVVRTHHMEWPAPAVWYAGTKTHFWFLPYLMVVTMATAVLVRAVKRVVVLRWPLVILLTLGGLTAAVWPEPAWATPGPYGQYFWEYSLRALPSTLFAIALGLAMAFDGRLPRSSVRTATIGGIVFVVALAAEEVWGGLRGFRAAAGLGCTALAFLPLVSPLVSRVGRLGRLSYGIYLSHLMFQRVANVTFEHFGVTQTFAIDIVIFVFTVASSILLSAALVRSRWTRWTIGG